MKALNLVLPLVVAASIAGAFFAGRYVGSYDAQQVHARATGLTVASESADRLYIAGGLADLLKNSKSLDALRVVEQYARVQAPTVGECLNTPGCSGWIASSEERRTALKRYVNTYGGSESSGGVK